MISLKKSYARHLLQLALTLSLLRVDPENYMGYGWESQLALQNGDGWQLELRAAPLTDFPYSNRKALIPLIEDLVRFDRQTNPSSYDVQTYLLNVQNEQISLSSVPLAPTSPIDTNTSLPMSSSHQQMQTQVTNKQGKKKTRNFFSVKLSMRCLEEKKKSLQILYISHFLPELFFLIIYFFPPFIRFRTEPDQINNI